MLTQRTLSFFGQALNNTSEQSEVSLFYVVIISIDFSPCGRRPSVHILLLTLAPSGVDRWFAALIESYD